MYKFVCEQPDDNGYGIPDSGCGEIDHVLFDGYSFGDRQLEGILFTLSNTGDVDGKLMISISMV